MSTVAIETASLISVRTLRWSKLASIIALLGLTPVISHVHLGVIRMTFLFAIIPAFTAWGLGALLVREIARRTQRGWATIVLLGCAVALAEECLFLQTSFFPLIGTDPQHAYGRISGVNWAYLLWALGYETVWAFVIPIFLIESLFPATRDKPWLGRVGLSLLAILFVGTGLARWYAWTQVFIPENFSAWNQGPSRFQVGFALLIVAAIAIATLVWGALSRRTLSTSVRVPSQGALTLAGCTLGLIWSVPLFLAYGVAPDVSILLVLGVGVAVCAMFSRVMIRWTGSMQWRRRDGFPLVFGALLASAMSGFLILYGGQAPGVDYAGKIVVNLFALTFVGWLWRAESKKSLLTNEGASGNVLDTMRVT